MKKYLSMLPGLVIAIALSGCGTTPKAPDEQAQKQPRSNDEINAYIKAGVDGAQRRLPVIQNAISMLTKVTAGNMEVYYTVRVLTVTVGEIKSRDFVARLRADQVPKKCSKENPNHFLELGVKLSYIFEDKNGRPFAATTFAKEDCVALHNQPWI
jgi:hypothetical protein